MRPVVNSLIIIIISFISPLQATSSAAERSDFIYFQGAPDDEAIITDLLKSDFTINAPKRIIYVAPFIDGSTQDGTGQSPSDPKRNLLKALESAEPGDHFYLAPGVYRIDKERDNFSNSHSQLLLKQSGTFDDRIVVTTDPNLFNPKNGQIAQLDFGFDNVRSGVDKRAIEMYASYWVFENLEIRNANDRIFSISGHYILIHNNDIHHCNHNATNNYGLIVMARSTGDYHNMIIRNHLHHSGIINTATGEMLSPDEQTGFLNGGCTYTETSQHYTSYANQVAAGYPIINDKGLNYNYPNWVNLTWETVSAWITQPDDEVYYYNNLLDHCAPYGLATKNNFADGKFYFLSNIIHQSKNGIKMTHSNGVIRNNIIYNDDGHMEVGLHWGDNPNGGKVLGQAKNATNVHVTNNTFVGMPYGIEHKAGWDGVVKNNIFLDAENPHLIQETYYAWKNPYGEYLIELTTEHTYYNDMPQVLKDQVGNYKKLEVSNNVYDTIPYAEPLYPVYRQYMEYLRHDGQAHDGSPILIWNDYTVLSSETIKANMINPMTNDFRINPANPGALLGFGSGILPKNDLKPSAPTQLRVQ